LVVFLGDVEEAILSGVDVHHFVFEILIFQGVAVFDNASLILTEFMT
jgi:hypothetical protein